MLSSGAIRSVSGSLVDILFISKKQIKITKTAMAIPLILEDDTCGRFNSLVEGGALSVSTLEVSLALKDLPCVPLVPTV